MARRVKGGRVPGLSTDVPQSRGDADSTVTWDNRDQGLNVDMGTTGPSVEVSRGRRYFDPVTIRDWGSQPQCRCWAGGPKFDDPQRSLISETETPVRRTLGRKSLTWTWGSGSTVSSKSSGTQVPGSRCKREQWTLDLGVRRRRRAPDTVL